MAHKLPPLRFSYDALEPYIDAETMELHVVAWDAVDELRDVMTGAG